MITSIIMIVIALAIGGYEGYQLGKKHATPPEPKRVERDILEFVRDDPLPENFNPRTDGGTELDESVPLKEIVPTYYHYDESGETDGSTNSGVPGVKV